MKRFLTLAAIAALTAVSCSEGATGEEVPPVSAVQDEAQLGMQPGERELPLNFTETAGLWLPYMGFEDYMSGRSEVQFREAMGAILDNARSEGINTVYFHAHPNGDAYYHSELFPAGTFMNGDFDPLGVAVELAHQRGISVHAWLNPLRLQTAEQMKSVPEKYVTRQWVDSGDPRVKLVGERWYLDPSYPEVTRLIADTAAEILEQYPVDGIHIDDYFYPTTDPEFDSAEFAASGADDPAQWRRDNVSRFVRALYDEVKAHDDRLKFGISPQGNIAADYGSQYADVALWAGTPGYADYIVPQLYYGFRNASCPFEATLRQWEELVRGSDTALIIGLAEYKTGKPDKWAGEAGESEWIDDPDIIPRQIELVKSSTAKGYALYR